MFNFEPAVISYVRMDNFIKNLEIKNFKSIKHLTLDCKRVNVFIGKPNVGKSNILEALGLLGPPSLKFQLEGYKFLDKIVRYNKLQNLFHENATKIGESINISSNLGYVGLLNYSHTLGFMFYLGGKELDGGLWSELNTENGEVFGPCFRINLNEKGEILKVFQDNFHELCKKYDFIGVDRYSYNDIGNHDSLFLHGENLFEIVDNLPQLRKEIANRIKDYGLDFVLSRIDNSFEIERREDGYVYKYPYSSIADTFQRFIFYLAAIESNKDSVLIFEEPEVHSFPPYVKELAERMILKDDNQYFVSTHSPYLLQTFIDSLDDTQLNVYLTYYKDYQTHVKALTSEELRDIQDFGYDVFFNLRKFEPND